MNFYDNLDCPHLVLDNFMDLTKLSVMLKDVDRITIWNNPNNGFSERQKGLIPKKKYEVHENYSDDFIPSFNRFVADRREVHQYIGDLIAFFNTNEFIKFLEDKTSIKGLFTDDLMKTGGLQKTIKDGYLNLHLDNNWNERLDAHNIVNCILFLSKDWNNNFGGSLELWNKNKKIKEIEPIFNRLVIRMNNENSFHGFPEPLRCSEKSCRLALVFFYYTREIEIVNKRSTAIWRV